MRSLACAAGRDQVICSDFPVARGAERAAYNSAMVAVLHAAPQTAAPQAVAAWLDTLSREYSASERASFAAALEHARSGCGDAAMPDGEAALDRALGTATIMAGLKLDPDSIRAALLLGLPVAGTFDADAIAAEFGNDVATLVAGVARMGVIRTTPSTGNAEERAAQAENLRKMLLSMVEDIRVVLIKLAERTQALRTLMTGDAALRTQVAREVLDLFAPLANRLGVWQLKWELEDLSLRALEPDAYKSIATMLDERRLDRQQLHRGRARDAAPRTGCRRGRRRSERTPQAHLQHLEQDAPQAGGHRCALRHPRGAHPGRFGEGLLHRARAGASSVDAAGAGVRRLHRQAQGQQLPFAAHGGHRARRQAARGADPDARDAPALRIRRRRPLALQGRCAEGRAPRSDLRRQDRVAAAGAGLEGRGRRFRRMAVGVQGKPLHRFHLRADAAGQGHRPAAWLDAGRLRVRRAHEPRPPLPRRHGRRPDGAVALHAEERAAGQCRHGQAGRAVARLAQSGPGLRAQPPRAHQGAAVVPRAAARRRRSRRDARWSSANSRAWARPR